MRHHKNAGTPRSANQKQLFGIWSDQGGFYEDVNMQGTCPVVFGSQQEAQQFLDTGMPADDRAAVTDAVVKQLTLNDLIDPDTGGVISADDALRLTAEAIAANGGEAVA